MFQAKVGSSTSAAKADVAVTTSTTERRAVRAFMATSQVLSGPRPLQLLHMQRGLLPNLALGLDRVNRSAEHRDLRHGAGSPHPTTDSPQAQL